MVPEEKTSAGHSGIANDMTRDYVQDIRRQPQQYPDVVGEDGLGIAWGRVDIPHLYGAPRQKAWPRLAQAALSSMRVRGRRGGVDVRTGKGVQGGFC